MMVVHDLVRTSAPQRGQMLGHPVVAERPSLGIHRFSETVRGHEDSVPFRHSKVSLVVGGIRQGAKRHTGYQHLVNSAGRLAQHEDRRHPGRGRGGDGGP